MKQILFSSVAICAAAAPVWAETTSAEPTWNVDDGTLFEVSVGDTQMFAPNELSDELRQIVPTESVLLLFEYYLHYRWHLSAVFNWPTDTAVSIVDGQLVEEYIAPFFAVGVVWTPLTIPFAQKRHRFELQGGVFGGLALRKQFTPNALFALRAYVLHESDFGVYVGAASSFIIDTAGLIYGVGYRF